MCRYDERVGWLVGLINQSKAAKRIRGVCAGRTERWSSADSFSLAIAAGMKGFAHG